MSQVRNCDSRHRVEVLLALDVFEHRAIPGLKHDQLAWALLHEWVAKAVHLMCFIGCLEVRVGRGGHGCG
jgi:hypothetical protein